MDLKDRRESRFTSQTMVSRVYQVSQDLTARLVTQDLMVALELLDHSDPLDILVYLVLPVLQARWAATVKDTQERKETRATWVCQVQVVPLETSL